MIVACNSSKSIRMNSVLEAKLLQQLLLLQKRLQLEPSKNEVGQHTP